MALVWPWAKILRSTQLTVSGSTPTYPWFGPFWDHGLRPWSRSPLMHRRTLEIKGFLGLERPFLDLVLETPIRPRGRGRPFFADQCTLCTGHCDRPVENSEPVKIEPETGTVGTVFLKTESRTGTAGTVFQEPKPEPEPSFPVKLYWNTDETARTENRNRLNRSIPKP